MFLAVLISWSWSARGQLKESTAPIWRGEEFKLNEGGIFFKLVPSRGLIKQGAGQSELKLIHTASLKVYKLDYHIVKDLKAAVKIWRLPVGEYRIAQLTVSTSRGSYQFKGPSQDTIQLGARKINNGGRWFAIERKNKQLLLVLKNPKVGVKPADGTGGIAIPKLPSQAGKASIKPQALPSQSKSPTPPPRLPSSRNPPKQKPLPIATPLPRGGQIPPKQAQGVAKPAQEKTEFQSPTSKKMLPKIVLPSQQSQRQYQDIRATYTVKQTIAMFYKIDLKRNNRFAPKFRKVIQENDANLRKCYITRLEDKHNLKGFIQFKFLYSRKDKAFRTLKVVKQTLNDPKMVECLYWEVAGLTFAVRKDMLGDLKFTFSTR